MEWINGLLSVKWGDSVDYIKCQGTIIIKCQMSRLNWLCQLGRYPDHGLLAFHASALPLSLVSLSKEERKKKKNIESVFIFILHFGADTILNEKHMVYNNSLMMIVYFYLMS